MWPERAMLGTACRDGIGGRSTAPAGRNRSKGVIVSTIVNADSTPIDRNAVERRTRDSIAFGRRRGFYRVLFDSGPVDAATFAELAGVTEHRARVWLEEQVDAGLLRIVDAPDGGREELLLPGEYVPILLGDHGEPELAGARALQAEHRADAERVRAVADAARMRAFVDAGRMTRVL
jgi:hypothetical protein